MSNKTSLQTNNTKIGANNNELLTILNTINNLPTGSSGGNVKRVIVNHIVEADANEIDLLTKPDGTPIGKITGDLLIRMYIPFDSEKTMPSTIYIRFIGSGGSMIGTAGYTNVNMSGAFASKDRLSLIRLYRTEDADGSNVRYDGFTSIRSAVDTTSGSAGSMGGNLTEPEEFAGIRITNVIEGQKIYIEEL